MRILERNVRGKIGAYMVSRGWGGFTLPIPLVGCCVFYWLLDGEEPGPRERQHEWVHVAQISRMGATRFALSYLWEMRHGYRFNKYEIEAYAAERKGVPT